MIRGDVVDALINSLADTPGEFTILCQQASDDERTEAARPAGKSVLSLTWPEAVAAGARMLAAGHAPLWLSQTEVPHEWALPGRSLADVLKTMPAARVARLRAELAVAGVSLDGDAS